jgi:hypothetical protein
MKIKKSPLASHTQKPFRALNVKILGPFFKFLLENEGIQMLAHSYAFTMPKIDPFIVDDGEIVGMLNKLVRPRSR